MITFAITLLCGTIGLVVDVGWGYFKRQSAQSAAEAAALAAASWAKSTNNLVCGAGGFSCTASSPCASTASGSELYVGCQYATQNGYTDGSGNQHVSMGAGTGTPTTATGVSNGVLWVTATVTEAIPQTFSRVLGSPSWMTASAQATASVPLGKSKDCIYALGTTGTVLTVTGNGTLTTSCNVYANSNSASAVSVGGSGSITISGGSKVSSHGGASGSITPAALTNQTAVSDPYAALQNASYIPATGSCKTQSGGTLAPGTYCATITGGSNLTLTTGGIYVFQQGINWSGGTLSGTNVFVYVSGGTIQGSGGTINLTAMTTGQYAGVALYQAVGDTNAMSFSGGFNMTGTGVIYAPAASMSFSGGAGYSATAMTLAASSFTFTGGASITSSATSAFTGGTPGLVQ